MTIEEQAANELYPYPSINNDYKDIIKKVREADKAREGFKSGANWKKSLITEHLNAAISMLEKIHPSQPLVGPVIDKLKEIK